VGNSDGFGRAFIGTSGWNYTSWKDDFYSGVRRSSWLEYYAQHFDALEVDGTFYHLLREKIASSWHERTPPDFRFALKGHRYITHLRRLAGCGKRILPHSTIM
jgi:uncharacterized protein YecE (DUF72 family)